MLSVNKRLSQSFLSAFLDTIYGDVNPAFITPWLLFSMGGQCFLSLLPMPGHRRSHHLGLKDRIERQEFENSTMALRHVTNRGEKNNTVQRYGYRILMCKVCSNFIISAEA